MADLAGLARPPRLPVRRADLDEPRARDHLLLSAGRDGVSPMAVAADTIGRERVRAELAAHRWQTPLPRVLVHHNGPLTARQRLWASLLAGPPGTVLGGLSAAAHDGLAGFTADALHLVAPGSSHNGWVRWAASCPWPVALRWSRMLGHEDVQLMEGPPRTRAARSILDAASERVAPARSRVIILAAVQQSVSRAPLLWEALSRRGRCRNRRIIAESIDDASGGIQSLPEREYTAILRDRRLPMPSRQASVARRDGRYFLDNDWEEWRVRAEIHGIPHLRVQNWDKDLSRQNELVIQQRGLLVFSSFAVRHEPRRVGEQTEALLRRQGWPG